MDGEKPSDEFKLFSEPEHRPFEMGDGRSGGALLIHGFPGTPAEMRPLGSWLADNGWYVRGILLPGFGPELLHLGDYSRSDWVSAAANAFEELRRTHGGPALIAGYSLGAAVALHLDLGPADRLALFAPFWRLPGVLPTLVPLMTLLFPELKPVQENSFSDPRMRRELERLLPGKDLDDPQAQASIQERLVLPSSAIREAVQLGQDGYRRAAKLDTNVLVVRGVDDPLVNQDLALKLTHRMAKSKATYMEVDAGHDLLVENSPAFAKILSALENFIDRGEV